MNVLDNNYYSDLAVTTSVDLKHPRIGYENLLLNATAIASSSEASFGPEKTLTPFTYQFWKPTTLPATITYDALTRITADYVGVAAHGLKNGLFKLQYSNDGSNYTTARAALIRKGEPFLLCFTPVTARYWRIEVDTESAFSASFFNSSETYQVSTQETGGPAAGCIGVLFLGRALAMQRKVYAGETPAVLARKNTYRPNQSEEGHFLGRSLIRRGRAQSFNFKNLESDWYRANFDPFVVHAETKPFFYAWRPDGKADECFFGQTSDMIEPSNAGVRDFMTVSFSATGHSNE